MNLGRRTIAGSLWNLLANSGQQVINFAFFVYMARLLEPTAFGIMALGLVVIDFAVSAGRLGLVEICIREEELDEGLVNQIFWFLQAAGVALTVIVLLLAWPAGAAFTAPDLTAILLCLAPVCWLQNLSAIPEARLQRAFGYRALAMRTLAGSLVGGGVGVAAALLGWGVFALAFQKITTVVVQNLVLWTSDPWRPSLPGRIYSAELTRAVRMGAHIAVSGVMQMLNTKLMDLMVAIFLGAAALGQLRTAWKIFEVLLYCTIQPLSTVSLVAFTRLNGDRVRLFDGYFRMTEVSALALAPLLLGASAVATLMVPLVFGERWEPAIPILQILGFMALAGAVDPFFAPMMTVTGHTEALVRQGAVQTVAAVALTMCTAPFGLAAVAIGQVVRSFAVAIVGLVMMKRSIGLPFATSRRAVWPAFAAAVPMWVAVMLAAPRIPVGPAGSWWQLALAVALGATVYGGVLALFFRGEIGELLLRVRSLVRGGGETPEQP